MEEIIIPIDQLFPLDDSPVCMYESVIHWENASDMEMFEYWWNKTGRHVFEDHYGPTEGNYFLE